MHAYMCVPRTCSRYVTHIHTHDVLLYRRQNDGVIYTHVHSVSSVRAHVRTDAEKKGQKRYVEVDVNNI